MPAQTHNMRHDERTGSTATAGGSDSLPIGVFDSGVGGLTVYRALHEHLPNERFVYLGDTARVPYGTKSLQTVERYAVENAQFLAARGIHYEQWTPPGTTEPDVSAQALLDAFAEKIETLKTLGGYVTADVIDVKPSTPGLEAMLAKFSREHWHDEDEVRLIVSGRGIFHIRPKDGPVHAIEVGAGDSIRVPAGTLHWFDLCEPREIRAVRLFQDPSGWTPCYTESGEEKGYQPVCLGPVYVRA